MRGRMRTAYLPPHEGPLLPSTQSGPESSGRKNLAAACRIRPSTHSRAASSYSSLASRTISSCVVMMISAPGPLPLSLSSSRRARAV